jgi:hypothetical protein
MTKQAWRIGDAAQCGANLVHIAAFDDGRTLVVGGGLFGPWSIWMNAAQLHHAEKQKMSALPTAHGMMHARRAAKLPAGRPHSMQFLQRRKDAPTLH